MLEEDRKSIFTRLTAIGFIITLLFGNLWFVDALLSGVPPSWFLDGFWTGLGIAFCGGIGLMIRAAWRRCSK